MFRWVLFVLSCYMLWMILIDIYWYKLAVMTWHQYYDPLVHKTTSTDDNSIHKWTFYIIHISPSSQCHPLNSHCYHLIPADCDKQGNIRIIIHFIFICLLRGVKYPYDGLFPLNQHAITLIAVYITYDMHNCMSNLQYVCLLTIFSIQYMQSSRLYSSHMSIKIS